MLILEGPGRLGGLNEMDTHHLEYPAVALLHVVGPSVNHIGRKGTRADALATSLYTAAQAHLSGHRLRTDYTDADPDQEADFYLLRNTNCPAVLTENLFMDNPADCALLLTEEGQQSLVDLHVDGICAYLGIR